MPFRLDEFRAKIQFVTSSEMPSLIYKACLKTGAPSNTAYLQMAVAEALSRDLDIPLEQITSRLPPHRGRATVLFGGDRRPAPRREPSNTVESVK